MGGEDLPVKFETLQLHAGTPFPPPTLPNPTLVLS